MKKLGDSLNNLEWKMPDLTDLLSKLEEDKTECPVMTREDAFLNNDLQWLMHDASFPVMKIDSSNNAIKIDPLNNLKWVEPDFSHLLSTLEEKRTR